MSVAIGSRWSCGISVEHFIIAQLMSLSWFCCGGEVDAAEQMLDPQPIKSASWLMKRR